MTNMMAPLPISSRHINVVGSIMSEIKQAALIETGDVRLLCLVNWYGLSERLYREGSDCLTLQQEDTIILRNIGKHSHPRSLNSQQQHLKHNLVHHGMS
jgi:hypothetical protein